MLFGQYSHPFDVILQVMLFFKYVKIMACYFVFSLDDKVINVGL